MKKILLFSIFLSTFLFLFSVEKAWAGCTGKSGCQMLSDCAKTASETPTNYCADNGLGEVCCEEKNTSSPTTTPKTGGETSGSGIQVPTDTGLPSGNIESVLAKILDWIEGIFLILSLIAFTIVGIMFLFSLGNTNSSAHTNAKAYFNQAITALLIVGGSYILIKTISYLLQG